MGDDPTCDLVIFSEAATRFSIERVKPRLGRYVAVAWVSEYCAIEGAEKASPACNFLNSMWEKTILMRRGYCTPEVCMSRVLSESLVDPNVIPLDCDKFRSADSTNVSTAEFGQDWYAFWNFAQHTAARNPGGGVYVDVGASLPFEYSNTVVFDRCLKWRGICVEPNPYLTSFLRGHRSCEVVAHCVDKTASPDRAFVGRDGKLEFSADCLPLGEILTRAGLRHRRIDVLSVDVEHGELSVLRGLTLDDFDIRVIIIEVTRGVRWLEVDTAILPWGYAKVAVLGRDSIYVKLEELRRYASWPFLGGRAAALPEDWAEFHERVIDEESVAEQIRERDAMYAGHRRTL